MHQPPARARRTALIAVLALLLAQALGLAHGVVHPRAADAIVQAAAAGDGSALHDEGSPQCRLLDQLTHADLLVPPMVQAPPIAPSPACVAVAVVAAPRLLIWRVHARGPPDFLA